MKVLVRSEHTVIVINGKPFGLYREKHPTHNDVCAMCDLVDYCRRGNGALNLIYLCQGEDNSGAWFFMEDWQHLNHRIFDFVNKADEKYLNSL